MRSSRRREHRGRNAGLGSVAVASLAAGLAVVAFAAPATAGATAKPVLISQAKASMRTENTFDEAHHIIPFKKGTVFTIACNFKGKNILCREHHGAERCVKGQPWLLLSDIFPIIKGRVGASLAYGLTETSHYCKAP